MYKETNKHLFAKIVLHADFNYKYLSSVCNLYVSRRGFANMENQE